MSTELQPQRDSLLHADRPKGVAPPRLRTRCRHAVRALAIILPFLAAGCAPRVAPQLSALCDGRSVVQELRISVDSVAPQAGPALEQVAGRSATLRLTLLNEIGGTRCVDQTGTATWMGELPAALEAATDPERRASWSVTGEDVVVNLNPFVVDNNLIIALPLGGGAGSWSLSTLVGPVATGRAIPDAGNP